jgi:hypothetical protein
MRAPDSQAATSARLQYLEYQDGNLTFLQAWYYYLKIVSRFSNFILNSMPCFERSGILFRVELRLDSPDSRSTQFASR